MHFFQDELNAEKASKDAIGDWDTIAQVGEEEEGVETEGEKSHCHVTERGSSGCLWGNWLKYCESPDSGQWSCSPQLHLLRTSWNVSHDTG